MQELPRNADSVKSRRNSTHKRKEDLLRFIEIQIDHVAMLLDAESGGMQ